MKSGIIQTNALADHYPVFLSIGDPCLKTSRSKETANSLFKLRRIFSTHNFQTFIEEVQRLDWASVLAEPNPDVALQIFLSVLFPVYELAFPLKTFDDNCSQGTSSWFSKSLRIARRQLDRAGRRLRFRNDPLLKCMFKLQRKNYKRAVATQYRCHYRRMGEKIKGKPKQAWQHINRCVGRKVKGPGVPVFLNVNGCRVEGPADISEAFLNYFSTIGEKTVSGLGNNKLASEEILQAFGDMPKFSFRTIEFCTIVNSARSLKGDFKNCLKTVPSKVYKQCIGLLVTPLHHIFNRSLETGKFPRSFKDTICVPLYKGKGDPSSPSNYRPIALTSFLAKLLERCVKHQVEGHFDAINFFSRNQYGFRAKRSTAMALRSIVDFITANCEGGHAVAAVFLDVAKAFDCVSHNLLLEILKCFSFDERALSWVNSFLSERKLSVFLNGTLSAEKQVSLGVPQGSVLGPHLFIVYINTLLSLIERNCPGIQIVTYADDTTLLFRINKHQPNDCIDALNTHLSYVYSLFSSVKLSINPSKTKLILFKTPGSRVYIEAGALTMNGTRLDPVETCSCLGLVLSSDIKWKEHYLSVLLKCYGIITMLGRLKQLGFKLDLLKTVYSALFEPVLFYGASVWGTTYSNVVNRFQVLQNDALRAIYGLPRYQSVRFVFKQQRILSVASVVKYRVATLLFKSLKATDGKVYSSEQPEPDRLSTLRSATKTFIKPCSYRSVLREQSPNIAGCRIWNALPETIKSCTTLRQFKIKLFDYLLANNFKE